MAQGQNLCGFVRGKIALLDADTSWARGMRAKLRRGVGKPPGELPEIWEVTLGDAPEQWNSRDGVPSFEQQAIHAALTLYALHRQGKERSMNLDGGDSLGTAVARLVKKDESNLAPVKRRFDAVVTAPELLELEHHARGAVQLLKAADLTLDYPRFAEDLYRWQFPEGAARVRLSWGQDFYGTRYKNKDEKGEKD